METRRICSQSTNHQNPPYFLFTFTPFPFQRSFLYPLFSITLSALHPHFRISATPPAAFHYVFFPPSLFLSLAPLPLLFSPPISVPFSVLVQHVKVGYRYAPLCLGANQWETGWGCCSRLGCWYHELRGEWEKVTVVHVLWSILQSEIVVLKYGIQEVWGCSTEMSSL